METHSFGVSSQEFNQCSKEIAKCLEMIRELARVKEDLLELQLENFKDKFSEVKEQQKHQLSKLQEDQQAQFAKMSDRPERSRLAQEQAITAMTNAHCKRNVRDTCRLNSMRKLIAWDSKSNRK